MPRIFPTPLHGAAKSIRRAEVIGTAAGLLLKMPYGSIHTPAQLMLEIGIADAYRQAHIVLDQMGAAAAMITWGWLSERTVAGMSNTPAYVPHPSELNEGKNLCISGIYPEASARIELITEFARNRFPEVGRIYLTDGFFVPRSHFTFIDLRTNHVHAVEERVSDEIC